MNYPELKNSQDRLIYAYNVKLNFNAVNQEERQSVLACFPGIIEDAAADDQKAAKFLGWVFEVLQGIYNNEERAQKNPHRAALGMAWLINRGLLNKLERAFNSRYCQTLTFGPEIANQSAGR